jgi:hypothetical protein
MSEQTPASSLPFSPRPRAKREHDRVVTFWAVLFGLLTFAAVIVGNGNIALAFVPAGCGLFVWVIYKAPLRLPALGLLAGALLLDTPADGFADGKWTTPWQILGTVLWAHLNTVVPIKALFFSGIDLLLLLLAALGIYRSSTKQTIDSAGRTEVARPIGEIALLSLVGVLLCLLWGIATGGEFRFAIWQVSRLIYLPLIFFLMQAGLRGPQDNLAAGKVLLVSALLRAVAAVVFRLLYPDIRVMAYATTHNDSILFACAFCMMLALLLERGSRKNLLLAGLTMPLLLWAMVANNRRLVWVEVLLTSVFFFALTPRNRVKRALARGATIAFVPFLLYLAVGWNSGGGGIFAPAKTIRSMLDSKSDRSTEWRDWENFNLIFTLGQHPVLGTGFGHPYDEVVVLDNVKDVYELEPYIPHNNILGIWAYCGWLGFTLIWGVFVTGAYFTIRTYRFATRTIDRVAALSALGAQIIYLTQGYGDMGLGAWNGVFLVATSYAVVGKLSVATGAWPQKRRERPPAPIYTPSSAPALPPGPSPQQSRPS